MIGLMQAPLPNYHHHCNRRVRRIDDSFIGIGIRFTNITVLIALVVVYLPT